MEKPKWRIYFWKHKTFYAKPQWYIQKNILWKKKYDSVRIELIPKYLFSWLWFHLDIVQGTDEEWEWFIWVTKYCDNDIQKAIDTFPWGTYDENKNFIRANPSINYNK